ncbi:hypothetical protein [Rhizobium lusitanum]|jgi:hypothetical protein|uniref:hypothetical protein n=1 Tax=Rhizobium lusitanum TaxID=293958 RepID=UPI000DDD204D|nr:hypothetical protein [Rhizobium lusitanum]NTJ07638.1 hypothetical protein [Rhizobium lusitanum]
MKLISGVIAVLAALLLLYSFGVFDPPIVKACEANLKNYLIRPSSYKRDGYILSEKPLTRSELEDRYARTYSRLDYDFKNLSADRLANIKQDIKGFQLESLKAFDKGSLNPTIYGAIIKFNAEDDENKPLNTLLECEYYSNDGKTSDMAAGDISLLKADSSDLYRIIQSEAALSPEKKQISLRPIAPYQGWFRDIFRWLIH